MKSFEKIGEVEGIGYTDERSDYNFNDKSLPLNGGMAYYRLKQVDFSGSFSYSDIIGVRIPSMAITNGIWRAYPNPTKGNKLNIDLVNSQEYSEEPITARLVSSLVGSVLIEGSTIQEVSEKLGNKLQTSPNGIYVIEVHWGQKREYLKVLKN
ncbi:T9SS C-terminal target domain-containing protein [Arthrospiribacter ruber]|uniref:T9SS C-terminal target domain-containing protein n=1 Tax=Arthrospiribacter ruber TaxID=2487934 RepID=A0A951IUF8_9BACT|nr:T9SS C-terminal target domain-containing protein [Arthrospiribacter ruber]